MLSTINNKEEEKRRRWFTIVIGSKNRLIILKIKASLHYLCNHISHPLVLISLNKIQEKLAEPNNNYKIANHNLKVKPTRNTILLSNKVPFLVTTFQVSQ